MRQIILDTETTGLTPQDGHRIIEVGCLEMVNRKFTGKRYHQYINPEREIEEKALEIHGITQQFLKDKPLFANIIDDFMNFISGAELIIHNAPFDVGFIDHELKLANSQWKSITKHCRVIDTLAMARQMHVGQRNSLDALCKRYGVDNSQRDLHGALIDVHLLGQVYLAMTGGQSSLFDEMQTQEAKSEESVTDIARVKKVRNLRVIKVSQDELSLHDAMTKKMKEKGKCVWE
jgi:DNA polymerase-3 subunit epsilon